MDRGSEPLDLSCHRRIDGDLLRRGGLPVLVVAGAVAGLVPVSTESVGRLAAVDARVELVVLRHGVVVAIHVLHEPVGRHDSDPRPGEFLQIVCLDDDVPAFRGEVQRRDLAVAHHVKARVLHHAQALLPRVVRDDQRLERADAELLAVVGQGDLAGTDAVADERTNGNHDERENGKRREGNLHASTSIGKLNRRNPPTPLSEKY